MLLKDKDTVLELIRFRLIKDQGVSLVISTQTLPTGPLPSIEVCQLEGKTWVAKFSVLSLDKKEILKDRSELAAILQKEGFKVLKT